MYMDNMSWRSSSYSNASSNNCVEVADTPGCTAVRDTKYREQAVLVFSGREWQAFVTGLTAGELG